MYLKSLKLVGFKSFADRTRLEFRPGVTVIVGPNGSGKSNLVDALSWVMGTQSTKALRTGKMEDVVFAGTATRPALGRAEATLVVDNEKRELPLDLDEVSLTRRLYRDGSSDYEINGATCRLLDIQELLSDSGVGRHQHIIISQGQVDAVLNASADDHRAVIEEAAGILKHRRRKERSERRLERTDEDMLRLRDLLGEIERQLRPLKRQARAAERYEGLKSDVTALVVYLSGQTLKELLAESKRLQAERADTSRRIQEFSGATEQLVRSQQDLNTKSGTTSADLERDSVAAARLETTMERLRRMGSIATERKRALAGRMEAAVTRRADLQSEKNAISFELEALKASLSEAIEEAQRRETQFRRLEAEEQALSTQTALSPEGAVAAVRGELSVLEASRVRDIREIQSLTHRIEVVSSQVADDRAQIVEINNEVQRIDAAVAEAQAEYQRGSTNRESDQETWNEAEKSYAAAQLAAAAADARADAVRSSLQEKFDLQARDLAESSRGALGTVMALLAVPEGLEKAVEAALGPWVDGVAFETTDDVRTAVASVKAAGLGGVPTLVGRILATNPDVEPGVDRLVEMLGEGADMTVAHALLGDFVVVEGWATAWEVVRRNPTLKAVTTDGDVVSSLGVRIAHPDGAGVAMLERAEIALERANTELSRARSILHSAKRDFEKSRESEREMLEHLEELEASLAGKTEAMRRLQQTVDSHIEESGRLETRRVSLTEAVAATDTASAEMKARLTALEGDEARRMALWEELEQRRQTAATEREAVRSDWQKADLDATSGLERQRLLEERLARIDADSERIGDPREAVLDPKPLESVVSYSKQAVELLSRRLVELRTRQEVSRSHHQELVASLRAVNTELDNKREEVAADKERLNKVELRLTEVRLETERVEERLRRDSEADVSDALDAARPEYPDGTDLEQVLEEKATQLRRLGPINPLAAVEYKELEERHSFLAGQMADVESSRSELRKVISALEAEIETRFESAFAEVAEAYQRYFSILFPGGRGLIRLVDGEVGENPGLAIEAQPLGKKVSQLTLLSGGERSLAALAFLFAVFEARPSPFYVLDEVEAALDDANLRRFLRIVDEFRERAQLLIVTHQQQTMEAADVLYGVTMEPGGSSQAIRKDMASVNSEFVA